MSMTAKQRSVAWFILGMLATALFVAFVQVVLTGVQKTDKISETQDTSVIAAQQRDQVLAEIRALAKDIRSCTDPDKECARRNQRATASAVGSIRQGNIIAATAAVSCAAKIPANATDREAFRVVYPCVLRKVQQASRAERARHQ